MLSARSRRGRLESRALARLGRVNSRAYIPELDGLRFLAIMFVLVWHSSLRASRYIDASSTTPAGTCRTWFAFFPHGEVGVILFFFISGFVVSQPFVAKPRESLADRRFLQASLYADLSALSHRHVAVLLRAWRSCTTRRSTPTPTNMRACRSNDSFLASLVFAHGIVFDIRHRGSTRRCGRSRSRSPSTRSCRR